MWFIKIVVCLDDLKIAHKKANKAKSTNELSSHNEDIKKILRMRKKRKDNKSRNTRFSDTDTSIDNNSNDGNTYPIISILSSKKSMNGKYYFQ